MLQVKPDAFRGHRGSHFVGNVAESVSHPESHSFGGKPRQLKVHGELVQKPQFLTVHQFVAYNDWAEPFSGKARHGETLLCEEEHASVVGAVKVGGVSHVMVGIQAAPAYAEPLLEVVGYNDRRPFGILS